MEVSEFHWGSPLPAEWSSKVDVILGSEPPTPSPQPLTSRLLTAKGDRVLQVQGYLAHKKAPPPQDHRGALGIVPL